MKLVFVIAMCMDTRFPVGVLILEPGTIGAFVCDWNFYVIF